MFNLTATSYIPSNVLETDGSTTTTYGSDETFACSIQPLSSTESIQYERKASGVFARMYCGMGVGIEPNYRIIDGDAVTWLVAGRARNTGGRSVFQTVDLERLK